MLGLRRGDSRGFLVVVSAKARPSPAASHRLRAALLDDAGEWTMEAAHTGPAATGRPRVWAGSCQLSGRASSLASRSLAPIWSKIGRNGLADRYTRGFPTVRCRTKPITPHRPRVRPTSDLSGRWIGSGRLRPFRGWHDRRPTATSPDAVPNDYGNDPWVEVLASWSTLHTRMVTYLATYLLARALGWRSRSPAELVRYGFDAAYDALSRDRLPGDAWRLLEDRLPWVLPFVAWDRCLRVRNAVVGLFVERNLPPSAFARISDDDAYFAHLAHAMARTYRGRSYLGRVWSEFDEGTVRRRLVQDLIDR
jgi:hypothetical protein